jgi:hypothetical protein
MDDSLSTISQSIRTIVVDPSRSDRRIPHSRTADAESGEKVVVRHRGGSAHVPSTYRKPADIHGAFRGSPGALVARSTPAISVLHIGWFRFVHDKVRQTRHRNTRRDETTLPSISTQRPDPSAAGSYDESYRFASDFATFRSGLISNFPYKLRE